MMGHGGFFIDSAWDGAAELHASYSPWLILLSCLVVVFAVTTGLYVARFARVTDDAGHRRIALALSAFVIGVGVWAMHFIGMLAHGLTRQGNYVNVVTLLSALPFIVGLILALGLLTGKGEPGWPRLVLSAIVVSLGIGGTHYIGMEAMHEMGLAMRYDPYIFVLSLVVGAVLYFVGLVLHFLLRQHPEWLPRLPRPLFSGFSLGLACIAVHYLGMAAAHFRGEPPPMSADAVVNVYITAVALALFTVTVAMIGIVYTWLLRTRELLRTLESSKQRLRAILDTAIDGIITIDKKGRIQSFNPSAERLFGWKAGEVMGRNIKMLMPEPDKGRHDSYLSNYLSTGKPKIIGIGREVMGLRKDGSLMPMRLAVGRVDLDDDLMFVGFVTDITDRHDLELSLRRAAEQAEQAAEAKTSFLANMSHEIRTPMNSIIGFTELLLKTGLTETQRSHLNTVRQSSRSLLGLLNDILDTTRMEKGGLTLEDIDFSLRDVASQVVSAMRLSAQAKKLTLSMDYPDEMYEYFQGDPLRVQQIITNLLGNAIKFTERGSVSLSFFYEPGFVQIDVRDTGIGMSPTQVESIFTPFTQADATISRRFGGTGLGTTISRQLVELMGGTIDVESVLGLGSLFHVRLPLPLGHRPVTARHGSDENGLPPMHLLIADDVPMNLELARLILEDDGHTVTTAGDGEEAFQRYVEGSYDLILMDVHMPEVDGLQAARRIRSYEQEQGKTPVPIIALTASVMAEDQRAARNAGMDGFAVKPLDTKQLLAEMRRVLKGERLDTVLAREGAATVGVSSTLINWSVGITRWGNADRFISGLKAFLNETGAKHPLPEPSQPDVDWDAARQSLHAIRGAAGNLAMPAVHELASALENLVRGGRGDDARPGIGQLRDLLAAAEQELAVYAPVTGAQTVAAPKPMPESVLLQHMRDLLTYLERNELNEQAMIAVYAGLASQGDMVYRESLKAMIDLFEFDQARAMLEQMIVDRSEQQAS